MKNRILTILTLVGACSTFHGLAPKDVEYYSSDPEIQEALDKARHETNHGTEWNRKELKLLKKQYPGKIIERTISEDYD